MLPEYIYEHESLTRSLDHRTATAGLRWDFWGHFLQWDICEKAQAYNSNHRENFRLKRKGHTNNIFSTNRTFYQDFKLTSSEELCAREVLILKKKQGFWSRHCISCNVQYQKISINCQLCLKKKGKYKRSLEGAPHDINCVRFWTLLTSDRCM